MAKKLHDPTRQINLSCKYRMSVQRSFAQRNNNVVNLVPEMPTSGYWSGENETYLLNIDPRNGSVFKVDLTDLDTNSRVLIE